MSLTQEILKQLDIFSEIYVQSLFKNYAAVIIKEGHLKRMTHSLCMMLGPDSTTYDSGKDTHSQMKKQCVRAYFINSVVQDYPGRPCMCIELPEKRDAWNISF